MVLEYYSWQFSIQYDSRVVYNDRRVFIGTATGVGSDRSAKGTTAKFFSHK